MNRAERRRAGLRGRSTRSSPKAVRASVMPPWLLPADRGFGRGKRYDEIEARARADARRQMEDD